jgi:hypothetical protein
MSKWVIPANAGGAEFGARGLEPAHALPAKISGKPPAFMRKQTVVDLLS